MTVEDDSIDPDLRRMHDLATASYVAGDLDAAESVGEAGLLRSSRAKLAIWESHFHYLLAEIAQARRDARTQRFVQAGVALEHLMKAGEILLACGDPEPILRGKIESTIRNLRRQPIVFISYARHDSERVVPIVDGLGAVLTLGPGSIEMDVRDFHAGPSIDMQIQGALQRATCVLIFMSLVYSQRNYCLTELIGAIRAVRSQQRSYPQRLVFVRLDDDEWFRELDVMHYIDARRHNALPDIVARLKNAVEQ